MEEKLSVIYDISPLTMPTRMMTAATPMMMPSIVRNERIRFDHMLFSASLNEFSIVLRFPIEDDPTVRDTNHALRLEGQRIIVCDHDDGRSVLIDIL